MRRVERLCGSGWDGWRGHFYVDAGVAKQLVDVTVTDVLAITDRIKARGADQMALHPLDGRPPYPCADDELRKVARDAFVSWRGSRYSVPWNYAGKEVWVRERNGAVEVRYGSCQIAQHAPAPHKHLIMRNAQHHEGIPLGLQRERKTLVHLREAAPMVEIRPLAAYEAAAIGGGL